MPALAGCLIRPMQYGIRALNQENLGSLAQEVGQLERLVADLRLLSQSDAGALDIQLAPMDLSDCLASRLDDADRWLVESGLALTEKIEPGIMIRGDACASYGITCWTTAAPTPSPRVSCA